MNTRKIIALIASFVMLVCFASCGNAGGNDTDSSVGGDGTESPVTKYASLEELNEAFGAKLCHPAVMGVTDESFSAIDCGDYTVAQYDFSVNSQAFTLRFCADSTDDISGINVGNSTAFAAFDGEGTVNTGEYYAGRWFNVDGQYVLSTACGDRDAEWFDSILTEMEDLTFPAVKPAAEGDYAAFAGEYQDKVSQRASMSVEADEDCVAVTVIWADSASSESKWTMTCRMYEDGLLSYDDCRCVKVEYDENGEATETEVYADGSGSFTPCDDGSVSWDGAEEENCRNCVFEKIG